MSTIMHAYFVIFHRVEMGDSLGAEIVQNVLTLFLELDALGSQEIFENLRVNLSILLAKGEKGPQSE